MEYHCPGFYLTVAFILAAKKDDSNRNYLTLFDASLGRTLLQVVQAQMISSRHFPVNWFCAPK